MFVMINVDHVKTAASQKKENVQMINVDDLETAALQKRKMFIMINVQSLPKYYGTI